jgi:hypothetical protein
MFHAELEEESHQKLIKGKSITIRNPQANAIVERVHQVIGNIIQTFELESNYLDEDDTWKGILSTTAFAVRSIFHESSKYSRTACVWKIYDL